MYSNDSVAFIYTPQTPQPLIGMFLLRHKISECFRLRHNVPTVLRPTKAPNQIHTWFKGMLTQFIKITQAVNLYNKIHIKKNPHVSVGNIFILNVSLIS